MDTKLKYPSCKEELDLKTDIKWISYGFLNDATVYYCGKCRAILNVGRRRGLSLSKVSGDR